MAKFKKAALAFVLAAVAAVSLMFVGCSGGGAEVDGVYNKSEPSYEAFAQGYLIHAQNDSMMVMTDNTFASVHIYDTLYSSDGTTFNPVSYVFYNLYGTFEVTNEDTTLNERTISITDVTAVETASGRVEKANFSADLTAALESNIIGKAVILTSDYQLSESLFSVAVYQAIGA